MSIHLPRKTRSLSRRLTIALTAMLVPLLVMAGAGALTSRRSVKALDDFRAETVGESTPIEHLREMLVAADDMGEAYVEEQSREMERQFHDLSDEVDLGFAQLASLSAPSERRLAATAHSIWSRAHTALREAASKPASRDGERLDAFHDLIDESAAMVADVYTLNAEQVAHEITALQDREAGELQGAIGILIASLLAAAGLARRVQRKISVPLASLEYAASQFGSADLSHRIEVQGDDEIARVSRAFNVMADKLEEGRNDLQYQALHDPLTGLANRTLFLDRMEHAIARADRRCLPFSVLYLDIDGLKAVNDGMGHQAGDAILVALAKHLKATLRSEDTAARLGGDEFAILLEEADAQGAIQTAQRLSSSFRATPVDASDKAQTSISIGIASRQDGEDLDQLLRHADAAMYAAKAAGKGQWQFFGRGAEAKAIAESELRHNLQVALSDRQFVVHYQPVIDFGTEAIQGVEALVRWNHPERGILPPSEFLTDLEETGQVLFLDRFVLGEACSQVRSWQESIPAAAGLCAYVNLSACQLQHPGLADDVAEALVTSKLSAENLVLEITETALIQDTAMASVELEKLRKLGVRIALDDFGTGYSSLTHLVSFPIDVIKIDRSFVSAISHKGDRPELIQALLKLAKAMGLRTVAEGIERKDQFDYLQGLDCELAQGYFFSKPLSPSDIEDLLRAELILTQKPVHIPG